jgi:hypothetical protein
MRRRPLRIGALLLGVSLFFPAGTIVGPTVPAAERPTSDEVRLLELANAERRSQDLPEVRWNGALARLARIHARDLREQGRLTHLSAADGSSYADRLAGAQLRVSAAAENLARATDIVEAHIGLMDSPGHRAAILNPSLLEVGIGVVAVEGRNLLYVVQAFATFMPGFSDEEAERVLRSALGDAWRQAGGPQPAEDAELSREVRAALETMVAADRPDSGAIQVPGPAWVFAYTATDPARLPAGVRARAGTVRRFGAAVTFRRTPSAPFGLYWVALALSEPVERP